MLIEQRSDAWFELRKGKMTSSEIYKIMGGEKTKDGLSETAKTYLLERVSEKLGGAPALSHPVGSRPAALEWGYELEELACNVYQEKRNMVVDKASFMIYNDYYGGSPDGLVKPDGIIEIKCPYASANHFKHGLIETDADFKKVAPSYYYQCLSNIICANAQWCDFISFDPRVQEDCGLFVYRLNRNEEEVENLKNRVDLAINYMNELKERILKKAQPQILA
jgi:hypothetical protein